MGPEFHAQLARQARAHGTRFVLDTSGAALREGLASGAWLIKPNLRELGQIAGRDVSDDPEQERVARELVDSGVVEVVVVSLGAAGALLVTAGRCERIRAPTVPIRSKVGAGDSTVAGIVLGMVRGMEVRRCGALRRGGRCRGGDDAGYRVMPARRHGTAVRAAAGRCRHSGRMSAAVATRRSSEPRQCVPRSVRTESIQPA
jgi:sugar/nucleoside kinase (ribokinase family)